MRTRSRIIGIDEAQRNYYDGDPRRQRRSGALLFWSAIAFAILAAVTYFDRRSGFLPTEISDHLNWLLAVPVVGMIVGFVWMAHLMDSHD